MQAQSQMTNYRSSMVSTKGAFNLTQWKELAKRHGVALTDEDLDTSNAADFLAKREAKELARARAALDQSKNNRIFAQSLSSGAPLTFQFCDWKKEKQPDSQLAWKTAKRVYLLADELKKSQTGFNIVLRGNRGTGKTSLAVATMNELKQEKGKTAVFVNTAELCGLYSQKLDARGRDERLNLQLQSVEKAMCEAEVLVLDDLGIEGGMGQARQVYKPMQDALYKVLNARYNAKKWRACIVTTNDNQSTLAQKYSPQIVSRLLNLQASRVVSFDGLQDVRNM